VVDDGRALRSCPRLYALAMVSPESRVGDKAALRRHYRALRRGVDDPAGRSRAICDRLIEHPAVVSASVVMVFDAIVGEPDLGGLRVWCAERGISVVVPEQEPDPAVIDVVVVPGVAFSVSGDRLGQGQGWYDRFLERLAPGAVAIGVAFAEQIAASLPTEDHDRRMDLVITDLGPASAVHPGQDSS